MYIFCPVDYSKFLYYSIRDGDFVYKWKNVVQVLTFRVRKKKNKQDYILFDSIL